MATANQVNKKLLLKHWSVVKYQILTYCFLNNISVSDADLECMTLLAMSGEAELNSFCKKGFDMKIFNSSQSVRNALRKAELKGLIVKEGKNKKKITLNRDMKIITKGNILLNYNFLGIETGKS